MRVYDDFFSMVEQPIAQVRALHYHAASVVRLRCDGFACRSFALVASPFADARSLESPMELPRPLLHSLCRACQQTVHL